MLTTLVWANHVNVDSLANHVDMSITNNLEGNEDLTLHCKSSENDLREQLLHINQTFKWGFGYNFFGGTKFICSFQWKNSPLLHFYAYNQNRDQGVCADCHWFIHKDGPCRYEKQPIEKPGPDVLRICYNWIKE